MKKMNQLSTKRLDLTDKPAGVYFYNIALSNGLEQYDGSFVIE